LKIKAANVVIY